MLRKFLALAAIAVASITPAHYAAAQPTITLPASLPGKIPNARAQATNIISSGAATPTTATFILSAESGTADDLVNVIVTGWNVGDTLKTKADAGDTITLKHGTGNITTDTGQDFDLDDSAYVWLDVTASGVTLRRGGAGGGDAILASSYGDLDDDEDWTTTLETAFAAAKAANKPFSCAGIAGYITVSNLDIPSLSAGETFTIRDCKFKHQTPDTDGTFTLRYSPSGDATNAGNLVLENIIIDKNGGTSALHTTGGFKFDDLESVTAYNVEVFGNNGGEAFRFEDIDRVNIYDGYAHDLFYYHTSETNDQVEGFVFKDVGVLHGDVTVRRAGRIDQTNASRDFYSRGITIDGVRGGSLNVYAERVDQCVDVSGSKHSRLQLSGTVKWCGTWGLKLANTNNGMSFSGLLVDQPGFAGVVFAAANPSDTALNGWTQYGNINGVTVRNVGTNQVWAANNSFGMGILSSGSNSWPRNIMFIGNSIISDTGEADFTASGDTLTLEETGMPTETGVRVRLTTTGTLPTGLSTGTDYYLINQPGTLTTKLASSFINAQDGTAITTTGAGSGTHTMTIQRDMDYAFFNEAVADSTAPIFAINNLINATGLSRDNRYVGIANIVDPRDNSYDIVRTDDGSAAGPELRLFRKSASPANSDGLGNIMWQGYNDAGEVTTYGQLLGAIGSVADGSERGFYALYTMHSGTLANRMTIEDGVYHPSATGGSQGNGTINFVEVYDNGNRVQTKAGTATNDDASAGHIGQIIVAEVLGGSAVSLSSTVANDIASISLTAGDWDLDGNICYSIGSSTSATRLQGWTSATSNTVPTAPNKGSEFLLQVSFPDSTAQCFPVGTQRISIASTTTHYLSARADHSGTVSAYGYIRARRVR